MRLEEDVLDVKKDMMGMKESLAEMKMKDTMKLLLAKSHEAVEGTEQSAA